MNKIGSTVGLLLLAVTCSLSILIISFLIYRVHEATDRLVNSNLAKSDMCRNQLSSNQLQGRLKNIPTAGDHAVLRTAAGEQAVLRTAAGDQAVLRTAAGEQAVLRTAAGDQAVYRVGTGDQVVLRPGDNPPAIGTDADGNSGYTSLSRDSVAPAASDRLARAHYLQPSAQPMTQTEDTHQKRMDCSSPHFVDSILYNIQDVVKLDFNSSHSHFNESQNTAQDSDCEESLDYATTLVTKVIKRLGVKCRRKSRIVKVYHHPRPEHLQVGEEFQVKLLVDTAMGDFEMESVHMENKEYATKLYERLENVMKKEDIKKKYYFHITAFTSMMEDDFSISSENTNWVWTRQTELTFGSRRVVLLLVSPGIADIDRLDCLQHSAANIRVNSLCMVKGENCVSSAKQKAEKVFRSCESDNNRNYGVLVVCWGCNVWHRWSQGFPVLHVQNSDIWNSIVWAYSD